MPPKKKKRLNEHPHVECWSNISTLSQTISQLTKQQHQYKALLLQISEITQHNTNVPDNKWTDKHVDFTDITDYLLSWLDKCDSRLIKQTEQRDDALRSLREADTDDDELLKSTAAILTDAEMTLKTIELLISKWKKIVRYSSRTITLREHTELWTKRWLSQWKITNDSKSTHLTRFRGVLTYISQESLLVLSENT